MAGGSGQVVVHSAGEMIDDFNRVAAGGWGVASNGYTWVDQFGGADPRTSVDGSIGHIAIPGNAGDSFCGGDLTAADAPWAGTDPDYEMEMRVRFSTVSQDDQLFTIELNRNSSGLNAPDIFQVSPVNSVSGGLVLSGRGGGTAGVTIASGWSAAAWYLIAVERGGGVLRAKIWLETGAEPDWQVSVATTTFTSSMNRLQILAYGDFPGGIDTEIDYISFGADPVLIYGR